jgi:hypothetical protein
MDIITHAVLSSVKWIYYWYTDHSEEVNPCGAGKTAHRVCFRGSCKNWIKIGLITYPKVFQNYWKQPACRFLFNNDATPRSRL